ncbi:MAG: thiamine phosphate synthase [Pseudomonadota bacterium]
MTQLYLTTPDGLANEIALADFASRLVAALDAVEVAALLLRHEEMEDQALARVAKRLAPLAQERGVAVLVEDRTKVAAAVDGIHLSAAAGKSVSAVRQEIGPESMVGVDCGRSRHRAMKAGEAGADYVAFTLSQPLADNDLELVAWWHEVTVVPLVVISEPDLEGAGRLAAAGADFLATGSAVWDHPEGPEKAVRALSQALALTARRC